MNLSRRAYSAIYGLLNMYSIPPGGSKSVTSRVLADFAVRASEANRLAMRILIEVPPHCDKDPEDMKELLARAEEMLAARERGEL